MGAIQSSEQSWGVCMCNEDDGEEALGSCLSGRKSFARMQTGQPANYNRSNWTRSKPSNIQIEPSTPRNVVYGASPPATKKVSDSSPHDFKPLLTPRSMGAMKSVDTPRTSGYPGNQTPRDLFSKNNSQSADVRPIPYTPRFRLSPEETLASPRSTSSKMAFSPRLSARGPKRELWQDSPRYYSTSKDGWIQSTVTISDMNISTWTQAKQDLFIEAIAATCNVDLSDVCILSLREKEGEHLTKTCSFQVKASSPDEAASIVRELKSQALDAMMLQVNIRIRPDTARLSEESSSQRLETSNSSFPIPFRNGYSLSDSYRMQFRHDMDGEVRGNPSVHMEGTEQVSEARLAADITSKPLHGTMLL